VFSQIEGVIITTRGSPRLIQCAIGEVHDRL
jgi:hypothetical protein